MEITRPRVRRSERSSGVEWRSRWGFSEGGRIRWEVAGSHRSQKEQAGGEGSKGRVSEGRNSG